MEKAFSDYSNKPFIPWSEEKKEEIRKQIKESGYNRFIL